MKKSTRKIPRPSHRRNNTCTHDGYTHVQTLDHSNCLSPFIKKKNHHYCTNEPRTHRSATESLLCELTRSPTHTISRPESRARRFGRLLSATSDPNTIRDCTRPNVNCWLTTNTSTKIVKKFHRFTDGFINERLFKRFGYSKHTHHRSHWRPTSDTYSNATEKRGENSLTANFSLFFTDISSEGKCERDTRTHPEGKLHPMPTEPTFSCHRGLKIAPIPKIHRAKFSHFFSDAIFYSLSPKVRLSLHFTSCHRFHKQFLQFQSHSSILKQLTSH